MLTVVTLLRDKFAILMSWYVVKMIRVDGEVLATVGALRNAIGCPASANESETKNGGALLKVHLMKQFFFCCKTP